MPLSFLTCPTLLFLPTCYIPTHSHKFCGESNPCCRNYFHVWYPRCAGSRTSGNYLICVTEEDVHAVGRILLHPVGQPYYPICIPPSSQYPTGVCTHSMSRSLLQEMHGTTWERVGLSGMGGEYYDPPPGWPPQTKKSPRCPITH